MLLLTVALLFVNEKELAIGRSMNERLRERTPAVEDGEITAYVAKVADRFRAQSPVPLTVEVTTSMDKRQFTSLPGGFIRIPLGAILQSDSEAVLAFIIAHAVAHIAKRHHIRESKLGTIPLIFIHFPHGEASLMPRAMKFEEAEREADALAAEWTRNYEATGDFEVIKQRVLAMVPARKPPTLRRASERRQ
jgi:predicted Zn-dependent protease